MVILKCDIIYMDIIYKFDIDIDKLFESNKKEVSNLVYYGDELIKKNDQVKNVKLKFDAIKNIICKNT